jgi:hypothetical protein
MHCRLRAPFRCFKPATLQVPEPSITATLSFAVYSPAPVLRNTVAGSPPATDAVSAWDYLASSKQKRDCNSFVLTSSQCSPYFLFFEFLFPQQKFNELVPFPEAILPEFEYACGLLQGSRLAGSMGQWRSKMEVRRGRVVTQGNANSFWPVLPSVTSTCSCRLGSIRLS